MTRLPFTFTHALPGPRTIRAWAATAPSASDHDSRHLRLGHRYRNVLTLAQLEHVVTAVVISGRKRLASRPAATGAAGAPARNHPTDVLKLRSQQDWSW
jgi:hypothetical protein